MLQNIQWKQLITQEFWFGIDRVGLHLTDRVILIGGAAIVVSGIVVLIIRFIKGDHLLKPALAKMTSVLLTIGLLEMLWFLLRAQYVNALGTRFTAVGILLVGLLWLIQPIRYLFFQYPAEYAEWEKQKSKEKYLQKR